MEVACRLCGREHRVDATSVESVEQALQARNLDCARVLGRSCMVGYDVEEIGIWLLDQPVNPSSRELWYREHEEDREKNIQWVKALEAARKPGVPAPRLVVREEPVRE